MFMDILVLSLSDRWLCFLRPQQQKSLASAGAWLTVMSCLSTFEYNKEVSQLEAGQFVNPHKCEKVPVPA